MAQVNSQSQSSTSSFVSPPYGDGAIPWLRSADPEDDQNGGINQAARNESSTARSNTRVAADNRSNAQGQAQITGSNCVLSTQTIDQTAAMTPPVAASVDDSSE